MGRRSRSATVDEATAKASAEGRGGGRTRGSERKPLTAADAKRLIGVGRTVAPLLAPYALAAATAIRGRWDAYRAARLGVSTDRLPAYAGPGGALHARIDRTAVALTELSEGVGGQPPTASGRALVERLRPRLADLAVAVRAAEQMPASRRKAAYQSIAG